MNCKDSTQILFYECKCEKDMNVVKNDLKTIHESIHFMTLEDLK